MKVRPEVPCGTISILLQIPRSDVQPPAPKKTLERVTKPWTGLSDEFFIHFSICFFNPLVGECLCIASLHSCGYVMICAEYCFRKLRIDSSSQEVVARLSHNMCRRKTAPGQQGMHRSWALWRMSLSTSGALGRPTFF